MNDNLGGRRLGINNEVTGHQTADSGVTRNAKPAEQTIRPLKLPIRNEVGGLGITAFCNILLTTLAFPIIAGVADGLA